MFAVQLFLIPFLSSVESAIGNDADVTVPHPEYVALFTCYTWPSCRKDTMRKARIALTLKNKFSRSNGSTGAYAKESV